MSTETTRRPDQTEQQDPKTQAPTPPFPQQQQEPPGTEKQLTPTADHGQESYRGSARLTDKVALITGGDSGIGRAVAIAFAREGADVVISYLNEDEDAAETERWVTDAGRRALSVPGDIGEEEHCRRLVERTVEEFGRLDILVNNAAWQDSGDTIAEMTGEEWRRILRTNLDAMFYLSRAAMEHLPEGGTIINVTSIQAYDPSPNLLPYATTKGGILTFTKALAKEAIEKGVRVNGVAPGPIWTPLIPSTMPPEKAEKFGEDTPTGRAGQPAELAPVFVFLASQESSYITGEVIGVTGGEPLG
ncbi:MAG TPA: SDR family oxidoreductase [Candidatus Limnocylindria bacterium]|nr:SDR family oxidoreductase [Candidatus Limnocylindria bacterium]